MGARTPWATHHLGPVDGSTEPWAGSSCLPRIAGQALGLLLQGAKPGQLVATQSVWSAFRDLQAHQVALIAASRAAVRATLDHFAPQQLTLRFERDGRKPLLATAGSRWRAYGRYHQALRQDDDWSERLLARDFAQAYEEQVRLIATLNIDPQG